MLYASKSSDATKNVALVWYNNCNFIYKNWGILHTAEMTRLSSLCYCAVFFNFVAWYYIVAIVSHINLIFHSVFNLKLPRREKVPRIA